MSSKKEALVEALENIAAGYRTVAVFPIETLSRTETRSLLERLDELEQTSSLLRRRLSGRLIVTQRMSA